MLRGLEIMRLKSPSVPDAANYDARTVQWPALEEMFL